MQKVIVSGISICFVIAATALLTKGCLFWGQIHNVKLINPDTGNSNSLYPGLSTNSHWIAVILFTLAFFLILYYSHMCYILNKYFSNALSAEKTKINRLFFVFLMAYTLRAIYCVGFGGYYDVVC